MAKSIAQLYSELTDDPWRVQVGFSPEVEATNQRLFQSGSKSEIEAETNNWLSKYQPCLFGRIAAKTGRLSYCVLTESDLLVDDEHIQDIIQTTRTAWTAAGYSGTKSGFIVFAMSERIATATPGETVKQIALRLCSMYLLQEIVPDAIFHDEIFLEKEGRSNATWKWLAGVNYFCAQGDKRWWHDHRIPGGIAFSVNSVGHMVKSTILSKGMVELNKALGVSEEGWDTTKVDSLETALGLAMMTIDRAADAISGRATRLLPIARDDNNEPVAKCPFALPPSVAKRNFSEYAGYYHTDVTVPSEYFHPRVERPSELHEHVLDFSYLFHKHIDNPAYLTMGEGRRIRDPGDGCGESDFRPAKLPRMEPELSLIDNSERLKRALEM